EYIVFRCFDGKSSTHDIAQRLRVERNVIVTGAHVARLRDRLHEKQLVLAPGEVATAEDMVVSSARGIAGLVMIDLKVSVNPDLFLTRLYHRIKRVVFRPAFFVALFALVGLATTIWLSAWDAIRLQAADLDIRDSFLLYYACLTVSIFAHEVSHGVVTKGFGGKVPKMGSFLYFFFFVFYTDVSASWMFPSKFRRLMVLFAGALANVLICAIATVLWRITIQGSAVNQVMFALMMINAVAASFTLFPLLRGDGYYIVSTAVDIPNLRQNSYRYVGACIRRIFIDRKTELPKATNRESLIYVWYAPLQILFFIGFFGYVIVRTAGWIVGELELLGFLIIVVVLLDRLARPAFRLVPGTLELLASAFRLGFSKGRRPLFALFARPFRDAARWVARMWKLELLIAIPIVILALIPYDLHISAPFEVISSGPVAVRPKTGGIVEKYLVRSGDAVKAGDVVAILMDDDLVLQRQIVMANLEQARAELAELESGYRDEEVAHAAVGARAQRQETALASDELRRVRNLYKQGISSRKELDEATAAYNTALAQERESKAELHMLDKGYRQEELDRQRAAVKRAEHECTVADQRLEWTKVRAIAAGRVVTPPHEIEQRIGKHVAAGDAVIEIVVPEQLVARLAVPERFASDVSVGMPITLRFFNEPDVAHEGRLDAVEPAVTRSENQQSGTLGIHTSLARRDGAMLLGTTGIAKIDAGSQSILGLLLRRAHRATWVTFWSWW
ncbi:MAG TPA: HlyD family efflux transporter periplasmic adaptor subunit, partial [Kofleriaceae bacterium]